MTLASTDEAYATMNSAAEESAIRQARAESMAPDLGQLLTQNRGPLLRGAMIGVVLGLLFGLTARPIYQAEAQIYIDPRDLNVLDEQLVGPADADNLAQALVESQVMMLGSQNVLEAVIDNLSLDEDPEFNGEAGGFISGAVGAVKSVFSSSEADGEDERRRVTFEALRRNVDIYRVGQSYVAELQASAWSREKAEVVLKGVLDAYLTSTVEARSSVALRASAELDESVAGLRERAETLQAEIADYKRANQISGVGETEVYDQLLADLKKELVNARVSEARLAARLASTEESGGLSETSPEAMASVPITKLTASLADIRAKMAQEATHATRTHPAFVALLAQEAAIETQIARSLDQMLDNLRRQRDRARRDVETLETQVTDLLSRSLDADQTQVRLREMESALSATWATYAKSLARAEQARAQTRVDISNVRVISEPSLAFGGGAAALVIAVLIFGALGGAVLTFALLFGLDLKARLSGGTQKN